MNYSESRKKILWNNIIRKEDYKSIKSCLLWQSVILIFVSSFLFLLSINLEEAREKYDEWWQEKPTKLKLLEKDNINKELIFLLRNEDLKKNLTLTVGKETYMSYTKGDYVWFDVSKTDYNGFKYKRPFLADLFGITLTVSIISLLILFFLRVTWVSESLLGIKASLKGAGIKSNRIVNFLGFLLKAPVLIVLVIIIYIFCIW